MEPTPVGSSRGIDEDSRSRTDPAVETVRRVAELARLALDPQEEQALARQFSQILEHFRVLARLDVSGVEATLGASRGRDVLRDDAPRPSLPPSAVLANAPAREADFYRVPKTVGGEG